MLRSILLWTFCFLNPLYLIAGEDCELIDNCRLVDINGSDDWVNIDGHYRNIGDCIEETNPGDTCLIRPGNYHEEIKINDKNNIAVRGDTDFERPTIDGTVELIPKASEWETDSINERTVCIGEIDIPDGKHPFQLFLEDSGKSGELNMMTNARWPNALWTDKNTETGTPLVFYNDYWGKSDETSTRGKMVDRKENGISPLAASGLDMKGAMAILNVGSWNTFVKPVKDHNAGDDFFTYEDDFGDNLHFKPDHNQYYLDSSEALLDNPGEWYYDMTTSILKFMPWSGSCPDINEYKVRGRVIDYGIEVIKADGLSISDIDFFAANIKAVATKTPKPEINEFYLDSCNFNFPSSSKRMLQDYSVPKITEIVGKKNGAISIVNCKFVGAEGSPLSFWGKDAKVQNNLFQWNDWTGQMMLKASGGFGTIHGASEQTNEEFSGNTMRYNGAESGYHGGEQPVILNNLVIGQCIGEILNDGSGIQLQRATQQNSLVEGNWVFDSPKLGIRFDGVKGKVSGTNGTIRNNVVWKTGGMMVKGDNHTVEGNLALTNNDLRWNETALKVVHILRDDGIVHNENTVVERNAAVLADGGEDRYSTEHAPWGHWQLAGIKHQNYYGNNSWYGPDGYDGSWVLDGVTVFPEIDLPDLLMSVDDFDFRPKPDTVLTSEGYQIGPYTAAYSNAKQYLIAGRKEEIASFPIPRDNAITQMRDALIFQPAFRCNGKNDKHMVYASLESEDFPSVDNPNMELSGDDNIISLQDLDIAISSGELYKWRVDCVPNGNKRRSGDVWHFTMND